MKHIIAFLAGLVLGALGLAMVTPAQAAEVDRPAWATLPGTFRATFYGSYFQDGMVTASGAPYQRDGDLCAVGPDLLAVLRSMPQAAEAFGLLPCWECEAVRWGFRLRLEDDQGVGTECRVLDTGMPGLDVDLPDDTFARLWHPDRGVVTVAIQIKVEGE